MTNFDRIKPSQQSGFTLIELVIIIVVLGILAAVAVPKFGDLSESSKVATTKKEMQTLCRAVVGNPDIVAAGQYVDLGFEGDVGFVPSSLTDLASKPDSVNAYNRLTRLGWNGPYIDSTNGDYLTDSWGAAYEHVPASRLIRSIGGTDTITVTY